MEANSAQSGSGLPNEGRDDGGWCQLLRNMNAIKNLRVMGCETGRRCSGGVQVRSALLSLLESAACCSSTACNVQAGRAASGPVSAAPNSSAVPVRCQRTECRASTKVRRAAQWPDRCHFAWPRQDGEKNARCRDRAWAQAYPTCILFERQKCQYQSQVAFSSCTRLYHPSAQHRLPRKRQRTDTDAKETLRWPGSLAVAAQSSARRERLLSPASAS